MKTDLTEAQRQALAVAMRGFASGNLRQIVHAEQILRMDEAIRRAMRDGYDDPDNYMV
ncbi:hypothetical protein P5V56_04250 [Mycobacteroides abscessus subsp. abscessus]|uniref:hypothetical protein n=1 Tax=Mycobacteroides abscessus TaxID=36809 RepID=UPI00266CC3C8|nr:hypothetical protein [Mycobacteroides abscessus]MDO3146393.1 hypothetical protein [Mycobacteroides abscessus subsp. abscessus]